LFSTLSNSTHANLPHPLAPVRYISSCIFAPDENSPEHLCHPAPDSPGLRRRAFERRTAKGNTTIKEDAVMNQ